MNFPPRMLVALGVIALLVSLVIGTVIAVSRRRHASPDAMALAVVVVLVLPTYWD